MSVIDAIVPVPTRGAQKEPFANGVWQAAGGGSWVDFVYERITIRYVASFNINTAIGMGESVLLDYEGPKPQEKPKQIKEDFSLYRDFTAEIVTVQ